MLAGIGRNPGARVETEVGIRLLDVAFIYCFDRALRLCLDCVQGTLVSVPFFVFDSDVSDDLRVIQSLDLGLGLRLFMAESCAHFLFLRTGLAWFRTCLSFREILVSFDVALFDLIGCTR